MTVHGAFSPQDDGRGAPHFILFVCFHYCAVARGHPAAPPGQGLSAPSVTHGNCGRDCPAGSSPPGGSQVCPAHHGFAVANSSGHVSDHFLRLVLTGRLFRIMNYFFYNSHANCKVFRKQGKRS